MKKNLMNKLNLKRKEVKKMKKGKFLLITVTMTMALLVILGTTAFAFPIIGFDPTGLGNYTTYADQWTSITDTGLSVGFDVTKVIIPTVTGTPYNTTFILQAAIGTMQKNGGVVTPAGLNTSYELTFETKIPETVTSEFSIPTIGGFATFHSNEDKTALLNVYFDSLPGGVHIPGNGAGTVSGYGDDDGIGPILTAHLFSADASFQAAVPGTLGTGSYNARFLIDSVNPKYIDVATGSIFDIEETGTLNQPPFYTPAAMWDGTPVPSGVNDINGIPLKYDGSADFSATGVPEPSTLLLLGIGLLGIGGFATRRKNRS